MPTHAWDWCWGAAAVAALVAGCDAQAAPTYQGEALLTLNGSVELDSERERGPLVPALAFFNSDWSTLHIVDVEVEGSFPSDFTLRVHQPPPPDVVFAEKAGRPAIAYGYITAVTPDHPTTIPYAASGGGSSGCGIGPNDEPLGCQIQESWCPSNGGECYEERRTCPHADSPIEDCEIVEASGDPALRIDPFSHFAGLSRDHRILYVEESITADDLPQLTDFGLNEVAAGYHLFVMRTTTEFEREEAQACLDEADALALERYNALHGTDISWDDEPMQWGGCPDTGEPCAEPEAEPPPEIDYDQLDALYDEAVDELQCEPPGFRLEAIENPSQESVSILIAPGLEAI